MGDTSGANRLEQRKARTRAALISAAQVFIGQGRLNVPILELTQAADVGMGSFYNHFASRDELLRVAVGEVLDRLGSVLDELTTGAGDPAQVFAQSFRLVGRLHRREPTASKVLLAEGLAFAGADTGVAVRARRDIDNGVRAGRFAVRDVELALTIVSGAALCLGKLLHVEPARDDAEAVDQVAEDLLRMLGLDAREAQEISRSPLPSIGDLLPG
ncbi:TetR/AcrR family transcriptional regulator [Nocardia asteroides]|uniref:TetR/AcrR family transcriptional regulator n=1 Tax=Nocardia asteroides TaxID=1824 RepID=UPI0037CAD419